MNADPIATRALGLARLAEFVPRAGQAYARDRNFDRGPGNRSNVSGLSPYLRHRLIGEDEVVRAVIRRHGMSAADQFVAEVCWRTYWKGWLEQRPGVWLDYLDGVVRARQGAAEDGALADRLAEAETGHTGIVCFDAWAQELVATGTLHNHARMWFASIWIFTLRLPWELGADFFYRHLLDGDPASNTLSWRWVAGLHTPGKHYLARAENIARFTDDRFNPAGELDETAEPLPPVAVVEPVRLRPPMSQPPGARTVVLLCEDDLTPEAWPLAHGSVCGVAALPVALTYPGLAPMIVHERAAAIADGLARAGALFNASATTLAQGREAMDLVAFVRETGAETVVTAQVPVGPSRAALETLIAGLEGSGIAVVEVRRDWDSAFWPYARRGFFQLKERIPETLERLQLL